MAQGEGTVAEVLVGTARYAVVCGDAAEVLRTIGDGVAAAIVTDPPSGIAFMGAEWDRDKGGRAQWVAWLAGILADARRCTRDGGRSVVWSLPRTSHWTGCAVEDAGWSVENTITHLFGTGWPKGKSQLKPAAETWWLSRTGRSTDLNVEACRVGSTKRVPGAVRGANTNASTYRLGAQTGDEDGHNPNVGRYPPNVVLSHAPGCVCVGTRKVAGQNPILRNESREVGFGGGTTRKPGPLGYADADGTETVEAWECVEGCPVAELDAQSGERTSGAWDGHRNRAKTLNAYGEFTVRDEKPREPSTGTASRFFPCFPADPAVFRYVAKPSSAEKEEGVGVEPESVDRYGEMGQGALPQQTPRVVGNSHPTVKSIALMRWLVDLVTQRDDLVIDPFGGSGTTGCAALASGRRVILIERDPRYAEIARQRCAHWGAEWSAPARASKRRAKRDADEGPQPSLFGLAGGAK